MTSDTHLRKARIIADYQFGRGTGDALFPDDVKFRLSTTGRIRQVLQGKERIATLRASDNLFTLGKLGAFRLHAFLPPPGMRVVRQGRQNCAHPNCSHSSTGWGSMCGSGSERIELMVALYQRRSTHRPHNPYFGLPGRMRRWL
jgi:hypothetical protein